MKLCSFEVANKSCGRTTLRLARLGYPLALVAGLRLDRATMLPSCHCSIMMAGAFSFVPEVETGLRRLQRHRRAASQATSSIDARRRPEVSYDFGLVDQTCRSVLDVRSFDPRATLPTRVDLLDPPPFENNFSGVAHTIYEPEHMMMVDTDGVFNTSDIQFGLVDSATSWCWPPAERGCDADLSHLLPSFGTAVPSAEDIYSTFSHTDSWPWLYQPWGGVWDAVFGTRDVDVARAALEAAFGVGWFYRYDRSAQSTKHARIACRRCHTSGEQRHSLHPTCVRS